jgi:hypothetical protein
MNQERKSVKCRTCKHSYLIATILALQCVLIQLVQAELLVHWWVSSIDMNHHDLYGDFMSPKCYHRH